MTPPFSVVVSMPCGPRSPGPSSSHRIHPKSMGSGQRPCCNPVAKSGPAVELNRRRELRISGGVSSPAHLYKTGSAPPPRSSRKREVRGRKSPPSVLSLFLRRVTRQICWTSPQTYGSQRGLGVVLRRMEAEFRRGPPCIMDDAPAHVIRGDPPP
jgi:hypothetical protein